MVRPGRAGGSVRKSDNGYYGPIHLTIVRFAIPILPLAEPRPRAETLPKAALKECSDICAMQLLYSKIMIVFAPKIAN